VGADSRSRTMEELLGTVLVRSGRITEAQLAQALRVQRKTLQRLGHVLVKRRLISVDDLVEGLRVQSLQIIYRLFRWRHGSYHFSTAEHVEYDDRHFIPISAETILMEGARMVDEWPIIERRIKSERAILRRAPAAEALNLSVESIVDRDIESDFGFSADPEPQPNQIRLSGEEREVLGLVDGRRTVHEITECSTLGEFDTYRVLAELVTRNLVADTGRGPVSTRPWREHRWADRLLGWTLQAIVGILVLAALVTLRSNPLTPWNLVGESEAIQRLRHHASQARLERIERAIQVFYLDTGSFPQQLQLLSVGGYLSPEELFDPWEREYGYALSPGGYRLFGLDPAGEIDPELSVFHAFSGLQRMMMQPGGDGAGAASSVN